MAVFPLVATHGSRGNAEADCGRKTRRDVDAGHPASSLPLNRDVGTCQRQLSNKATSFPRANESPQRGLAKQNPPLRGRHSRLHVTSSGFLQTDWFSDRPRSGAIKRLRPTG
jgi:hypothetical protein